VTSPLQAFKYTRKDTFLDSLDPRSKFFLSISLLLISLFTQSITVQLAVIGSTFLLVAAAKRLRQWVPTLQAITPLVLLIFAVNLLFSTPPSLAYAALMSLRFLAVTAAFSMFFLTTTPDDLALALEQSGVPREYSLMFTMSLRFIPTLAEDVETVGAALMSRGFKLDEGNIIKRAKNYVYLLVPLIVYEVRRSLMIAEALEARAFGASEKPTRVKELKMRARDYIVLAASLLASFSPQIIMWLGLNPP